jgi:hypothetical protein
MSILVTIFSAVLAVLRSAPALAGLALKFISAVENFVTWFINNRIDQMAKENRDAIKKAVVDQDQRDLEKAIGSPTAGEPSGIPGTVIRDALPGVKK